MALEKGLPPKVSVIIPCLGHARELGFCLDALRAQAGGIPFEIIVVDSASDLAVQAAASNHPDAILLRSEAPLTPGAARNVGAARARADILVFLDADSIPDPGWLKAAHDCVDGGALLAGGPIGDVQPWNFIAASDNRLQFVDFPRRRPPGIHPYIPGTHLAMPRKLFESAGRFDPDSLVTQDLLLTLPVAQASPEKVRFCPPMSVRHWGRSTWPEFLNHQRLFGYSRGVHRLRMDSSLSWLGRHPALGWMVVLRRLTYLTLRVMQWNLQDLPRFVLQIPFLLIGLVAWTRGFYEGMQDSSSDAGAAGEWRIRV